MNSRNGSLPEAADASAASGDKSEGAVSALSGGPDLDGGLPDGNGAVSPGPNGGFGGFGSLDDDGGGAGDPVDWGLARRVALRTARREPYTAPRWRDGLEEDFARCTALAEELVAECTGLRSKSGPARGAVTGRAGWIDANLASFRRLLSPVAAKLSSGANTPTARLARRVAGIELGVMLGWMSTRVLGQYDLLVIEDEKPEDQDIVYYVAPNVLALESRYAFDPSQFRLWLAIHEVTHRAQFTAVDWMRPHFISLVESVLEAVDPDPKRVVVAAQRLLEARRRGVDPLEAGGLTALFASEAQVETLEQMSGLMSLLEGHGDVVMDRAGEGLIPSAPRFGRVMRRRRESVRGFAKVFQRLIGLDAKLKQYAEGEHFIATVEEVGGTALLDRVWEQPANVPDIAEIRDPRRWVSRMTAAEPVEAVEATESVEATA
ncbi:MAG: zinc-dependent metalloprotease [Acidimicrobiaceae bacterium]|nr:zinc-dependent metalloprotease [Acidimicrobiaceae bacterium]MCY4280561.1 zinc-dependent metalloprotease [Acidimicrobiaceae bacterium]MCY4293371.1 zinc-dependent metalloprotease [Acidimicrobiaceae bacterium]